MWSVKTPYVMFPVENGISGEYASFGNDDGMWDKAGTGAADKRGLHEIKEYGSSVCTPKPGVEYLCEYMKDNPMTLVFDSVIEPILGNHCYYYFRDIATDNRYPIADYVIDALIIDPTYKWHNGCVSAEWNIERRNGKWFSLYPKGMEINYHGLFHPSFRC